MRGHIMNISWALILLLNPIWYNMIRPKKHFYRNHKWCQFQFKYHNWSGKREQRMCITKHFISFSVAPFVEKKEKTLWLDFVQCHKEKCFLFTSNISFSPHNFHSYTQREMCGFFLRCSFKPYGKLIMDVKKVSSILIRS